ncbi:MAG TPA: nitronate monooxygenase family protein [bacterium]|nr:nitronate monooxygenase family protein [bacterium]
MHLPKLSIGDLQVEKPIIQGGMGVGISLSGLASAVANQGGVGVISSVALGLISDQTKYSKKANIELLSQEIQKARNKTDGVIGVNIMVALTQYEELVKTSIKEEADIVFIGAGLPLKLPGFFSESEWQNKTTKVAVIVSSARAAGLIFKIWDKKYKCVPDAVVVEGQKAGGHLGFKENQIDDHQYALEELIPQVRESIDKFSDKYNQPIPVIAAGGIFYGGDIKKFLDLGADGVKMGTRFVATEECDADDKFKQQFVNCQEKDLTIIKSPVGLPGRAIKNGFLEQVKNGIKKPFSCPWKCLKTCDYKKAPYCIAQALVSAQKGIMEHGFAFAGSNAYLIDKIVSVRELFQTLIEEFEKAANLEKQLAY